MNNSQRRNTTLKQAIAVTAFIAFLGGTVLLTTSCEEDANNNKNPNKPPVGQTGPKNPCPTNPNIECACPTNPIVCQTCKTAPCICVKGPQNPCPTNPNIECACPAIINQCPKTTSPKECDCLLPLSNEQLAQLFRDFARDCGLGLCGTDHVQLVIDTPGMPNEPGTSFNTFVRNAVSGCLSNWSRENLFLGRGKNVTALGTYDQDVATGRISNIQFHTVNITDRPMNWNSVTQRGNTGNLGSNGIITQYSIDFARIERQQ